MILVLFLTMWATLCTVFMCWDYGRLLRERKQVKRFKLNADYWENSALTWRRMYLANKTSASLAQGLLDRKLSGISTPDGTYAVEYTKL